MELVDVAAAQVAPQRVDQRFVARLGREVRNRSCWVDLDEVRAVTLETVTGERFRKPTLERNDERAVVLVTVAVDHHDDPVEVREDEERLATDQLRVLQRDLWRQQRLRDAPVGVHRKEAQLPRQARDEVKPSTRELRLQKESRGQKRLDALIRASVQGDALSGHARSLSRWAL